MVLDKIQQPCVTAVRQVYSNEIACLLNVAEYFIQHKCGLLNVPNWTNSEALGFQIWQSTGC